MRSRKAEIRNSSRPGSQAPHAPPALTFGLPGKQSVNQREAGRDLIRLLSSLPVIRKVLPIDEPDPPRFCPDEAKILLVRAFFGQCDLVVQEVREFDSLRLERLRIERGLGETRQSIGFEID